MRYGYNFDDTWLINTHNGIKERGISPVDINDYPAIKAHLDMFWEKLSVRSDKGDTPYNLRNCVYTDDFSKQKIVWKRVGSIVRFCFDDMGLFCLDSTCFMTGNNLKYITLLLNSPIGHYMLQSSPKTGTGDLLLSVQAIEPIRSPHISPELSKQFDIVYERFMNNQISEEEVNRMIFSVFELSESEISYILSLDK